MGPRPTELVIHRGEEPDVTLYNCFRHHVLPSTSTPHAMVRVKTLRMPDICLAHRCLEGLESMLPPKWQQAQGHPHIATVQFYPVREEGRPEVNPLSVALIMPEYRNGNILEYIKRVGAPQSDRMKWLLQIADALDHIHKLDIVHGNLHVNNILIDDNGDALLADAAIYTTVIQNFVPTEALSRVGFPDSLPCKPVELVREKDLRLATPAVRCDIFAFAVTIWTVLNGEEPFRGYEWAPLMIQHIEEYGHRNLQSVGGMSDGLWRLLRNVIWQHSIQHWPTLKAIKSELQLYQS